MTRRPLQSGLLCCLAALTAASTQSLAGGGTADDPQTWVARMNHALSHRNYDGVFVHQLGDHRETLRIIHQVRDGHMKERLVSIDGTGREFVRDGNELVSYFPSRRIVVVERRSRGPGFIGGLRDLDTDAQENYEIRDIERTRMQGRPTRVITVTPRDSFRYGYRLWIDEKTAMPVKTQLSSASGDIIEQITFASLALPPLIDDELLKTEISTEGFRWLRREPPNGAQTSQLAWTAGQLPPGFRRSVAMVSGMPGPPKPSSHLVFTDGLASVSVFIERADAPKVISRDGTPRKSDGPAQLGAAAAYTALTEGHRVTAVGEVPPITVKAIAESLRPVAAPTNQLDSAAEPAPQEGTLGRNDALSAERLQNAGKDFRGLGPTNKPAESKAANPR